MAKIKQEVISTTDAEKYGRLIAQLDARKGTVIIFVKTKYGTEKLAAKLNKDAHHADAIHGDLQQRRRDRVIQGFRDKKYRVLVATDVAARGLDIPHIAHVINYDMPQVPEDYIHRIGRTARAGAEGEAVSFLTCADSVKWRAIQRLMNGEDPNALPRAAAVGRAQDLVPARASLSGKRTATSHTAIGRIVKGIRVTEPMAISLKATGLTMTSRGVNVPIATDRVMIALIAIVRTVTSPTARDQKRKVSGERVVAKQQGQKRQTIR